MLSNKIKTVKHNNSNLSSKNQTKPKTKLIGTNTGLKILHLIGYSKLKTPISFHINYIFGQFLNPPEV